MKKKTEEKLMKPSSSSHCSSARDFLLSPLLLISFTTAVAIFYCMDLCYISKVHYKDHEDPTNRTISVPESKKVLIKIPFNVEEANGGCDIFKGRWVRDYDRPLYQEDECPYIAGQLTCLAHGRPEKDYQFWRWQPRDCSLPSFDAKLMLEALRGKRLLFAGDSLNRNQFTSLICLLHRDIPEDAGSLETIDTGNRFIAKEYNATIEFYWAPFLLESNSDDSLNHRGSDRIIRNSTMEKHGKYWKGADVLIFNTYIWWISGQRILRNSFEDEVKDIVKMTSDSGYRMAIKSLVRWIESNVDPKRTRTFFASMSPTHKRNFLWGRTEKGNCYSETRMIEDPTFFGAKRSFMKIMDEEFAKSKVPITFLNITQLSSVRKEAHTSIYKEQWGPLSEEQLADPKSYADCIHWCLPGLPDTWNELLFAKLFYPSMP